MFAYYSSETDYNSCHHLGSKSDKHHSSSTKTNYPQNHFIKNNNVRHTESTYNSEKNFFKLASKPSSDITHKNSVEFDRIRLKQEQERRYNLCAEKEKLLRERANLLSSKKQAQNRDALKKFYERKAKEVGQTERKAKEVGQTERKANAVGQTERKANEVGQTNRVNNGEQPQNLASTNSITDSNKQQRIKSPKNQSNRDLIERIRAGYTIIKFIKYHVSRQKTRRILSRLCQLRMIENLFISLKSTNKLFDDSTCKTLEQLDQIRSDDSEIVSIRKKNIIKMGLNTQNEKRLNIKSLLKS